jgi:SAM-dependent methyltransferase
LTGVDGSPPALAVAREQCGAALHRADLRRFAARARSGVFGLVSLNDVIEHFAVDDAIELMCQVRRISRPGGLVLLKTPNMHNPLALARRYCDLTHRTGFTVQSLGQVLARAGLATVWIGPEPAAPAYRSGLAHRALRGTALLGRAVASAGAWALSRHFGIRGPFWLSDNLVAVGRIASTPA